MESAALIVGMLLGFYYFGVYWNIAERSLLGFLNPMCLIEALFVMLTRPLTWVLIVIYVVCMFGSANKK